MARLLAIYFNALFGALGGLLGWLLFGQLVHPEWPWWVQGLVGGALIGAVVGYLVSSVDAILDRTLIRFTRYACFGILLGGLGGALGFFLGDWVNYALIGATGPEGTAAKFVSILARGFGWSIFGLLVGISEGITARSLGKISYGAIGGALGGFIGGCAFAYLMLALEKGEGSYLWGQAFGLILLGACIGSLTALVEEVLKPASLRVVRGWQEGREYPLVKPVSVLGRDESVDVLLLRDMHVEKRHAAIHRRKNGFFLVQETTPTASTLVNDQQVEQSLELHDGDRIQLGNVILRFQARAAKASTRRPARPTPSRNGR